MEKIKFSDLTVQLKIAVVLAYVVGGIWLLMFFAGFIAAALNIGGV